MSPNVLPPLTRALEADQARVYISGGVGRIEFTEDGFQAWLQGELDAHERAVREQAAREIHDRAATYADALPGYRASFRRGMLAAARHIAPTPTPQEITDAIARGDAVFCDPPEGAS